MCISDIATFAADVQKNYDNVRSREMKNVSLVNEWGVGYSKYFL